MTTEGTLATVREQWECGRTCHLHLELYTGVYGSVLSAPVDSEYEYDDPLPPLWYCYRYWEAVQYKDCPPVPEPWVCSADVRGGTLDDVWKWLANPKAYP